MMQADAGGSVAACPGELGDAPGASPLAPRM
jgi:hypothetical protein